MATKTAGTGRRPAGRTGAKRAPARGAALEFNHAMIYTADYARAIEFYRGRLGFQLLDEYSGAYARLRSPGASTTLALHCLDKGQRMDPAREGVRLYFETRQLDATCRRLAAAGVRFDQMPKAMPWGWRHAYLRDPDGHEISLYWAGRKRLSRTTMAG